MLTWHGETRAWVIDAWEEPARDDRISQDELLVLETSTRLRVAVIDGVSPPAATPSEAGVDGAVWAAGVVRTSLHSTAPIRKCLAKANALLFQEGLPKAHRPAATVAVADIGRRGVRCGRAGDAEIWELRDKWAPVFSGRPFAKNRPGQRLSGAIGHWPELILEQATRPTPRALVLASDGARLSLRALHDLEDWLGDLRRWERRRHNARKPHDDITVVRLQRSLQ